MDFRGNRKERNGGAKVAEVDRYNELSGCVVKGYRKER